MKDFCLSSGLLLVLFFFLIQCDSSSPSAPILEPLDHLPENRKATLTHGVHVNRPFLIYSVYSNTFDPGKAEKEFGDDEIALVASLGFRHVRLSFEMRDLYNASQPEVLDAIFAEALSKTVDKLIEAKIGVVLNLLPVANQPSGALIFEGLQHNDETVEKVGIFWHALASYMSDKNPDYLFFEVLNEPNFSTGVAHEYDIERWDWVLGELHGQIRAAAPQHTIIVGGIQGNSIWGMEQMTPLADKNVVYNFHFYASHTFTHQGAEGMSPYNELHDLPYPSSPELIAPLLTEYEPGSDAYTLLEAYGNENWNREKIETHIGYAAEWASKHDAFVTCNEFGVYKKFSPIDDRNLWHKDVRETLEANSIGWCKHDFDLWGVIEYTNWYELSGPYVDEAVMEALGM